MPKKNLVIVEDDFNYQNELREQVIQLDSVILKASFNTIEDALGYVKNNRDVDLFLLDIGLPGMDGITGLSELKKILPHSKSIILSVYDDRETILDALTKGACGYLHKCEAENRLPTATNEVISGGHYFTPEVSQTILETIKTKPFSKSNLTNREKDVLKCLAKGLVKKQIADELGLKYGTIDTHVKNIYKKLNVHCAAQAVFKATDKGWL